jgi:hypothetical protein
MLTGVHKCSLLFYANYLALARQNALVSHNDSASEVVRAAEAGFQASGASGMLQGTIEAQNRLIAQGAGSCYDVAETYALAGNKKEALTHLRCAIERREMAIVGIRIDQQFDSLRGDPSFLELVTRVGSAQ